MTTLPDIRAAAHRIAGLIRATPLERSRWLSDLTGAEVLLKLETHQRTGSFKVRGAANGVLALPAGAAARGIVTASAGNHGLGVALAAAESGHDARIYVPSDAPRVKLERIALFGARVVTVDGGYDAADAAAREDAAGSGAIYIHAFSDPAVIEGQATVGLEMLEERPDLRVLLAPVGGGGLVGGIGVLARALNPEVRVIGVQSAHTSSMAASLAAGRVEPGAQGPTLCDGLAGSIDETSLDLARQVVDEMIVVPEADVASAIVELHRHEGVLAEGSAAVVVAALLGWRLPSGHGPIGAVLTGSNIDLSTLRSLPEN